MMTTSKPNEVIRMIEIKNENLVIDGNSIGNEEEVLTILEKAQKWDELQASFEKGGDSQ